MWYVLRFLTTNTTITPPYHLLITSLSLTEAQLVPSKLQQTNAHASETLAVLWEQDWYDYRLSEITSGVFKMDAKDSVFVFVLLLLSLGLFGSLSLTYCVWNKQTEVTSELADLQNELQTKLESKVQNELKKVLQVALNDRVQLGASDPSQDEGQLK